jgi:broad specificity phosphatase PhoE
MSESLPTVYLARHGETAWTISRQHTGRTDLPLTARGEDDAWSLHGRLRGLAFDRVFVSPLRRARQTSLLAGFGDEAVAVADLTEWDYGEYEGLTTAEIRRERPGWSLFRHGCPGGESVAAVGARADRVIARLRGMPGRILVFGHGQFFGVLAARWVRLPPGEARRFVHRSASLSILGYEHGPEDPAIRLWNDDGHAVLVRPGGTQNAPTSFVHDRPRFAGHARSCRTGPTSSTASTRPPE